MRRSSLPRSTKPLKRTEMRKRSAKYAQRNRDQFGPHANYIRKLTCALCKAPFQRVTAHHTTHVSQVGTARHLVPLCGDGTRGCHGLMHGAWKDRDECVRVKVRLAKRAAALWETSPARHLYCATCDRYKGKRACPACVNVA